MLKTSRLPAAVLPKLPSVPFVGLLSVYLVHILSGLVSSQASLNDRVAALFNSTIAGQ